MLDLVGLRAVASKRAGTFSLGMSQRLGIAAAMLGDPRVLLLDEPVNGLDPEGVLWIRNLMKYLAGRGPHDPGLQPPDERDGGDRRPPDRDRPRQADRRLGHGGRIARSSEQSVLVRTPDAARLTPLIEAEGGKVSPVTPAAEPGAAADTAPP